MALNSHAVRRSSAGVVWNTHGRQFLCLDSLTDSLKFRHAGRRLPHTQTPVRAPLRCSEAACSFATTRCLISSRREGALEVGRGWAAQLDTLQPLCLCSASAKSTVDTVALLHLASGKGAPNQVLSFGCHPDRSCSRRCHLPPPAPIKSGPGHGWASPHPLCVP